MILEETYELNNGIEISSEDMRALNATGGLDDYGDSSFFPVLGGKL